MMAGRDAETEREREGGKAAAVLELMSACQIRNTMHLRQNKKRGGWTYRRISGTFCG